MSQRTCEDARQTELLRKAWTDRRKAHGYRDLQDDLLDQGEEPCRLPFKACGQQRPNSLQAPAGQRSRQTVCRGRSCTGPAVRCRRTGQGAGGRYHLYPNPGGLCQSDCRDRPVSGHIIGWSLQSRQTRDVVLQALLIAVWRRKPKTKVSIDPDQDSQFGSVPQKPQP
jgi:putative transposase